MKHRFIPLIISLMTYGELQSQLVPAKDAFDKKWISNKTEQMNMFAVTDKGRIEIGNIITRTSVKDDRLLIVTEVNMNGASTAWTDSTIAELKTGKPIHHSSFNMQRNMVLEFGKIVTGYYYDKKKEYKYFY